MSRIGEQVERELVPQVDTLRDLSETGQPGNGRPFTGLEQLFERYLDRTAPPPDGALVTFVGDQRYKVNAESDAAGLGRAFGGVAASPSASSGELDTELGEARYIAVPVSAGDENGLLVVAALTAAEREQVESAVRIAIGVSVVILLLASLFIWLAAGRAIAPLQALSRTARTISETDLSGRIPVRGGDEIAELGRTFNSMLDRLETAFADQKDFLTDVGH